MPRPELWIVAGPNGAGKTTSVQRAPLAGLISGVTFLNPDDRTLLKLKAAGHSGFADAPPDVQRATFAAAADEVQAELEAAVAAARPVGIETVLSTDKYRPLVESVRARAGFVGLLYIALSSPTLSAERVAARVRRGGHGVPEDRLAARWQRSLDQLAWFGGRVNDFWVYDNSGTVDLPLPLLARGDGGQLRFLAEMAFPEMKTALAALTNT